MEESQDTSKYLYEDEQVFLTDDNKLFLKDGPEAPKLLCEVSADNVEDKIAELKQEFSELEKAVDEILAEDSLDEKDISDLKDRTAETKAIGDFDTLLETIDDHNDGPQEAETEEEPETEKTAESVAKEGQEAVKDNASEQSDGGKDDDKEDSVTGAVEDDEAENQESTPETAADTSEESDTADDEKTADKTNDEDDDEIAYYRQIVKEARELSKETDNWSHITGELDQLSRKWSDGPDLDSDEVKNLFKKFNNAVSHFEDRKEEYYKKQDEKKQQNLEKKKSLLEEFEGIISNETWTATKRVGQMKGQWNSIGRLPSGRGEKLDDRFEELVDTFDEHKVDRMVQKRQKEEDNLMGKLTVIEKIEQLAKNITHETTSWDEIADKLDDLTKQWKRIGRVPREKSDEVWDNYKAARDNYYDQKYKYDPDHQSKVDRFSHKKDKICEEAEALVDMDDIAIAARKVNKLHHRWKKVGNLPQGLEDEYWDRFKAATDAFNEKKANNQDKIEKQEEEHYQQKLKLIDEAKALKDTDDFKKGHSKMQGFMDKWKAIGPVSRKKSNKIWKEFKGAMDEFYDRRREHFKNQKENQKENLERKKELLEKLHELGRHEDPIEAVDIAKGVQEKFKNVGYVPIKKKDEMWQKYREACDVIYDRMRAAKSGDKFDQELAKASLDPEDRNKIQKLRKKYKAVKKDVRELENEAINYKEKKTYFTASSSGGNSLLDQLEEKIDSAEEKIEEKVEKLDELTKQMDLIRKNDGE